MENSQLKGFIAVVEEGGVSRAAAKLHLTQPAVTKQIQALERELQTALFDRTSRSLELTATGTLLYDYARRSLALLDECQSAIADREAGTAGNLSLGAGTTTCIFELPRWLQALRTQLPGIDVMVRTGESREIVQMILAREVDLGLITTAVQHPDLHVIQLFEEEVVLVTSGTFPPISSDANKSSVLSDYPLILFPHTSGFREYLDQALIRADLEVQVKMETDSLEAIKSFVATGLGASFLPMRAVESELATGVLQRVQLPTLPVLKRQTSVIHRSDRHLSPGAKALLKILQHPETNNSPPVETGGE